MTDQTFQNDFAARRRSLRSAHADRIGQTVGGFFDRPAAGWLRNLYEDFRAVPAEAWVILAVATVLSNLFIALA